MTTITDKQAAILRRKGISFTPTTSRNEARGLVKLALKAASPKTRRYLDVLGISYDPFISQDQADAAIRHHESETRRLYSELESTPDLLFDLANSTTTWARVTSHHAKGFWGVAIRCYRSAARLILRRVRLSLRTNGALM